MERHPQAAHTGKIFAISVNRASSRTLQGNETRAYLIPHTKKSTPNGIYKMNHQTAVEKH